jgi:membrane protein DedA with SNARE-associated domain
VLAYIGYRLGPKWPILKEYFHRFDAVIGVVIVAGVAWFVYDRWKNRLRST